MTYVTMPKVHIRLRNWITVLGTISTLQETEHTTTNLSSAAARRRHGGLRVASLLHTKARVEGLVVLARRRTTRARQSLGEVTRMVRDSHTTNRGTKLISNYALMC